MSNTHIKIYKYLCISIFFLILLGGAVRSANAGLACPDWPLCFGDLIPDFHIEVYFEFIHRALAGAIGLVSIYLNVKILRFKKYSRSLKFTAGLSIVVLILQVIMGGLTVLLMLHDKIVAMHLALGTGFFALSFWNYLSLVKPPSESELATLEKPSVFQFTMVVLVAIYGQIILGGLVASNYAGLVCPTFPLCHGQFIPTLSGQIGLQVIHRLGAYTLTAIIVAYFFAIKIRWKLVDLYPLVNMLLSVLGLQIVIGISNVLYSTPPLLTVLHLAVGVTLLATVVKIMRLLIRG